jgi:hypothetical protein
MSGGGDQNELTMDYKWVDEWLRGANLAMMWIETVEKDVHAERFDSTPERLLRTRVRYRTADGITQLDPVCKRMPPHGW